MMQTVINILLVVIVVFSAALSTITYFQLRRLEKYYASTDAVEDEA